MNKKTKTLEERFKESEAAGKTKEETKYEMLEDGFQRISGIPDDFYSAEDPADRAALWQNYKGKYRRGQYRGGCSHCGSTCCSGACD